VCEKRISLGYNQTDLGRALGLTFQQIQKYEKGSNRISASKLWDIARFFHVDIAYFFQGLAIDGAAADADPTAETRPVTRLTVEISRLAPRMSAAQQRLALEIIREMTSPGLTAWPDGSAPPAETRS
jgi:transcriptional regulator with XRE-family HTH domain